MGYGHCVYRRANGVYIARLCVPVALQERLEKKEIHFSTGLRVRALAITAATTALSRWRSVFAELLRLDVLKVVEGSPLLIGRDGELLRLTDAASALGMEPKLLMNELAGRGCTFWCMAEQWDTCQVDDLRNVDREGDDYLWSSIEGEGTPRLISGMVALRGSAELAHQITTSERASVWCIDYLSPGSPGGVFARPGAVAVGLDNLSARKKDIEALRLHYASSFSAEQVSNARAKRLAESVTPPSSALSLSSSPALAQAAPPASSHVTHRHTGRHSSKRVSELIDLFITSKTKIEVGEKRAPWKADEELRNRQKLRCFPELMDDPTLGDLQLMPEAEEIIRVYKRRLVRMPSGPALSKARRELPHATAADLVKWASTRPVALLNSNTAQDYVSKLSECFRWGVSKTYLHVNPAAGLQGDGRNREQRPDEAREKFTSEDLARIFGADWFKTGRPKLTQNGALTKHFRPVHYWLPLLALLTGGRANELGQLYLSDICDRDGSSPYVAFRLVHADQIDADEPDSLPDKSLKTVNSKRNVPIHEALIRLGFLDYVEALAAAGYTRVFPELSFDTTKGYGLAARKWFNEHYLGRTLKIERNGKKTLHSLRHNFSTAAHDSGIVGRIHKQLMGHERGETLAELRYTKDAEPKDVKALIDKMEFDLPPIAPLDIPVALQAISHALAAKRKR